MTKELYLQDYYTSDTSDYVPLRWMAPECITQGKFSIYSDVVWTGEGGREGGLLYIWYSWICSSQMDGSRVYYTGQVLHIQRCGKDRGGREGGGRPIWHVGVFIYRIDSDLTIKVGDFGMTKELYIQDYYTSDTSDYVPLRWMAPECITQGKFSIYSDVVWNIWIFTFLSSGKLTRSLLHKIELVGLEQSMPHKHFSYFI